MTDEDEVPEVVVIPLLPGEKNEAVELDDVHHWLGVYAELLEFKRAAIATMRSAIAGMTSPEARTEARRRDLEKLENQEARYRGRMAFWNARLADFQPRGGAASTDLAG